MNNTCRVTRDINVLKDEWGYFDYYCHDYGFNSVWYLIIDGVVDLNKYIYGY